MRYDFLTLFPSTVEAYLAVGVLGQALRAGILDARVHDLRRWSVNRYGQVDDEPYGGGPGMVLLAPVVVSAVRALAGPSTRVVVPDPRGRRFDDGVARELAGCEHLLFVCGRYEGFDERIRRLLTVEEVSLGDFVVSGGELPALTVADAAARYLAGVVGDFGSVEADSFATGLLDHPVYTRPRSFEGEEVPDVLLSGDHEAVRRWRLESAVRLTLRHRPDLIGAGWSGFSAEVRKVITDVARQEAIPLPAPESFP